MNIICMSYVPGFEAQLEQQLAATLVVVVASVHVVVPVGCSGDPIERRGGESSLAPRRLERRTTANGAAAAFAKMQPCRGRRSTKHERSISSGLWLRMHARYLSSAGLAARSVVHASRILSLSLSAPPQTSTPWHHASSHQLLN